MAKLMLGARYLRLDPTIQTWQLDDVRHMDNLKALADSAFDRQSCRILADIKGI